MARGDCRVKNSTLTLCFFPFSFCLFFFSGRSGRGRQSAGPHRAVTGTDHSDLPRSSVDRPEGLPRALSKAFEGLFQNCPLDNPGPSRGVESLASASGVTDISSDDGEPPSPSLAKRVAQGPLRSIAEFPRDLVPFGPISRTAHDSSDSALDLDSEVDSGDQLVGDQLGKESIFISLCYCAITFSFIRG